MMQGALSMTLMMQAGTPNRRQIQRTTFAARSDGLRGKLTPRQSIRIA